ncbi:MAG TPA: histidine kinase [Anaerolineales bacterium]|nr:histidine kinase [Anaerolineales bacterium]HLO30081.1 histidine kinase [Anaerolineales bacterium]
MLHLAENEGKMERTRSQILSERNEASDLREIVAASGISVRVWRLYAYFWLVCLVFPILALIQTHPSGLRLLIGTSGLVIFTATYFWVMWPHPLNERGRSRLSLRKSLALQITLTALVLFLSRLYGSSFLWLFIGVGAIAGITLPFRRAATIVMGLTLLTLGVSISMGRDIASADWLQIIPLALLVRGLGLDMIGFIRLSDALRELHHARAELAYQAVTEERLRMARDLHDLLGHTLSLITLKSELAGRLLEKEPLTAEQEIREVERIARQALREVREAVAGYRQQTLRGELDAARQILEAAGIECGIEYEAPVFSSEIDNVLGWVVREGVTNVIRHSRAQHCLIRVTSTDQHARVEVSNDGYPPENNMANQPGSGLSGLAERVAKQDGHLEAGPQSKAGFPGFRLLVDLPLKVGVSGEVR